MLATKIHHKYMKKIKQLRILRMSFYDLWVLRRISQYKRRSKRIINQYQSENAIKKLHIGCGGNLMTGWLNSDIFPETRQVAYLDASLVFPLSDGTFDYVYSEHVFEHLTFQQQLNYLKESLRILKPGGKLRIATPDFNFLVRLADQNRSELEERYLHWNSKAFLQPVLQELTNLKTPDVYVINNYFKDWGHQLIHNPSSLSNLLEHAGFVNISTAKVCNSSDVHLLDLERHSEIITEEYNLLETFVLEAEKAS